MRQDNLTHSGVTIGMEQNKTHMGKFWTFGDKVTINAGATQYYLIDIGEIPIFAKPATIITSVDKVDFKFYNRAVTTADGTEKEVWNHNRKSAYARKQPALKFYSGPTVQLKVVDAGTGGGFANQPAGDTLTIVSDDAADIGQTVTIYGTKTGTTTTITSETVTLNGTTAVDTTTTTWQNILAIELSAVAAGTVTISEKSGGLAITTITTGDLSAGVATLTGQNFNGVIPSIVASDTSTAPVGIYGYNKAGTLISVVQALNGVTPASAGSTAFYEVEKVFIGAVAATRTVTVSTTRPGLPFSDSYIPGATGVGGTRAGAEVQPIYEYEFDANDKVILEIVNGSSATNIVSWKIKYSEED